MKGIREMRKIELLIVIVILGLLAVLFVLFCGCVESQRADNSFRVATNNPQIQAEWDAFKQHTGRDDELTILAFNLWRVDRMKVPVSAVYKRVPDPNDPNKLILVNRIDEIEKQLDTIVESQKGAIFIASKVYVDPNGE